MNFLSFLFPQVIEDINSPINGEIKVIQQYGSIHISVSGLSQSGGLVKNLWESGIKKIHNSKFIIHNSLVLGVGGGTVIKLLNKYYPAAKIVGIEIDPLMIELGKKYFQHNELKNVDIIISDAINWVNKKYHESNHSTFDLILVDLYIGKQMPQGLSDKKFLEKLKALLNANGAIIFNRLRNRENKQEIEEFINRLINIFPSVTIEKPLVNYLIFCH